jgi:ABC-type branched-subunit amino acid transport system substrate-binding protein
MLLRILAVFLVLLLAPLTTLAEQPAQTLTIGVISGMTGLAAKWDHFQNQGITLAQEELEQSGTKIKLIFEDSQTQGTKAVAAFNKLIDYDHVDAVIADDFGYVIAPLLPLAAQRKKLLLATSLPQKSYCGAAPGYFFSIASQYQYAEPAFERFFQAHSEIKRAALFIFDDPEWGQTYHDLWLRLAARHGVEIVETFETAEPAPNFNSVLARVLLKKPDVLLLAHEPILFSRAVLASSYQGPILSANNFLEVLAAKENLGRVANQVYLADPEIDATFAQRFEARFKESPILEAYSGYEALRTLAKAFAADRAHPEKGMRTIKYAGIAGTIDFSGESCSGNYARWGLFTPRGSRLVPAMFEAQKSQF